MIYAPSGATAIEEEEKEEGNNRRSQWPARMRCLSQLKHFFLFGL
jgi:hypothetical protein